MHLVAVHGGAGDHSPAHDRDVKRAMRRACTTAMDMLDRDIFAPDAVAAAISVLEDDPCLNAGHGSNLTLDGTVECDASIMDGEDEAFGSVGAVSGVKNPILAAFEVQKHSRTRDPMGRIPPMNLVSHGAYAMAMRLNLEIVGPETMVTDRAHSEWEKWRFRLGESSIGSMQDTVGAVCWDQNNGLASGVSSGGILLKSPGRIGEAAVFGAGCWASSPPTKNIGIACSISGTGEQIIRANLASNLCKRALSSIEDVNDVIKDVLLNEFRSVHNPDAGVGTIVLVKEEDPNNKLQARLWCAFTTPSMAVAYASSADPTPRALIIRRPPPLGIPNLDRVYITSLPLTRI